MKTACEVGTIRIGGLAAKRVFILALVCGLSLGVAGCQNGKCNTCLFANRDKEVIDSTQLGQDKDQGPPAPPTEASSSPFDSGRLSGESSSVVLESSPSTPALVPETALAANDSKAADAHTIPIIPNTAGNVGSDDASQPTSLAALPDAHSQARSYSGASPSSTFSAGSAEPQFQSVAPIDPDERESDAQDGTLGFAPATQDHSASLSSELKDDPLPPAPNSISSLPPELISQEPEEVTSGNSSLNPVEPPVESPTVDPAQEAPESDQRSIDSDYVSKAPVTLKGSAQARYISNAAAPATTTQRRPPVRPGTRASQTARPNSAANASTPRSAASAPLARPMETDAFTPNGQVSQIIPGMRLGVVDFSNRAR